MRHIIKILAGVLLLSSCAVYVPAVTDPDTPQPTTTYTDTVTTESTTTTTTTTDPMVTIVTTTTEAPTTTTTTTTPPTTTTTTVPGIPAASPGISTAQLSTWRSPTVPSGDGTGNFRTFCRYSHMNYDDSIVKPGQPGASHLHTYFGNTGSNAMSTSASLSTTGDSTCAGGILNRSSYWVPSVLDANGVPLVPVGNIIYYKSGYQGVNPSSAIVLPDGLRVVAGSSTATAPQEHINWGCSGDWFGFPTNTYNKVIPSCPEGSIIHATITFPQCWDGVNLDSADHKSHLAYGTYGVGCPSTHPVPIPEISYHVDWNVPAGGTVGWHLSSDMGQPGGLTLHADYVSAWDVPTSDTWLNNCTRVNADCEVNIIGPNLELTEWWW